MAEASATANAALSAAACKEENPITMLDLTSDVLSNDEDEDAVLTVGLKI